jgi:hypothetical protein
MKPTLFSVTFKNPVHKNQEVICAATNPETARTYVNDLLNELGHSDWTYVSIIPIRAGIFNAGEGKLITMNETARATA